MSAHNRFRLAKSKRHDAVALLIVLAFVVLLTGVVVAYFSRSTAERSISASTSHQIKADILALSALDIVKADLKQEIFKGAASPPAPTSTNILPERFGYSPPSASTDLVPNLVRRSWRGDIAATVPSRASAVNSTTDVSTNKRYVDLTRWNSHYLIPRHDTSTTIDATPVSPLNNPPESDGFTPPDWVMVTTTGPQILSTPDSSTIGRYAYTIFDEGGLIDVNVAGCPTITSADHLGRKGYAAFALLGQIPASTSSPPFSTGQVDNIIGWRNYATIKPAGTLSANYTFTLPQATAYHDYVIANSGGFLQVNPATPFNGQTDRAYTSRQDLTKYRRTTDFSQNALKYMGTFSRDRNIPTLASTLGFKASGTFSRRDGTTAKAGDPLLHRFSVSRIGQLAALFNATSPTSVQEGLVQRDFGLILKTDAGGKKCWGYVGPQGTDLQLGIASPSDPAREANFFELLAFGMGGSPTIGQVLVAGACVIDQYDSDTDVNTKIKYSDGTTDQYAYGIEATKSDPLAPTDPGTPRLDRAFQNVGEMGYASRDGTANTLDFASSTDAKILDLFCINETFLQAGMINLNTRTVGPLTTMLAQTYKSPTGSPLGNGATGAAGIDNAIVTRNKTPANRATSRGDLGAITAAPSIGSKAGTTSSEQEAISRALADVSSTRTWNLMIDLIAQSGRYKPGATNLADFVVQGETRYWLHVAIDRFTGELIDQQLEAIYE